MILPTGEVPSGVVCTKDPITGLDKGVCSTMRYLNAMAKPLPLFALMLLLGSLLAGCGGGGGGGGGNSGGGGGGGGNGGGNVIINGTVIDTAPNSTPLVGRTVEFDGGHAVKTGQGGAFSLSVSSVSTSD